MDPLDALREQLKTERLTQRRPVYLRPARDLGLEGLHDIVFENSSNMTTAIQLNPAELAALRDKIDAYLKEIP